MIWDSPLSEHGLLHLQWTAVIAASLVAAGTDWQTGRIPNALTGPLFLAGLAWALYVAGVVGLFDALAGMFLMGLPFVILFIFAGGGAGDAKLMGALGAWLGVGQSVLALLTVLVAGAVYGLIAAVWRGQFLETLKRMWRSVVTVFFAVILRTMPKPATEGRRPLEAGQVAIPYGVPICIGVCAAAVRVLIWP